MKAKIKATANASMPKRKPQILVNEDKLIDIPEPLEGEQGDRYGSIQAHRNNGEILIRLDKSQKLIWFKPKTSQRSS